MLPSRRRPTRHGFTLIELLCVVLILGIIATLGITKFGAAKRRAHLASMKSDLWNLAFMAEAQYTIDDSYAAFTAPQGSEGVTLTYTATATQWVATATHESEPDVVCTMKNGAGASTEPECH